MWIAELLVVLFFIWFGARLGSIGIGYAGGFGVLVLSVGFGLKPGEIPFDVILIIMGVIAAIAAMQEAGGLDYLVQVAENVLKKNPKYITFLAPAVTYVMTLFAGTGHTAFLALPVIAEVAKKREYALHGHWQLERLHRRLPSRLPLFPRPSSSFHPRWNPLEWITSNSCSSPFPALSSLVCSGPSSPISWVRT